jgi:predicted aldo/keto reductase-like oxidoreductase
MKRRLFLKTVGGIAGGAAISANHLSATEYNFPTDQQESNAGLPRRPLGQTGEQLSIIGFPANCLRHYDQKESTSGIRKAIERGVNYIDVAPAYGRDGECEIKLGIGLEGLRNRVFLASKTKKRDKQGARKELETSLKRLKTDYLDLYQMHFLARMEEVNQAFGPGGAMETMIKAKEEGIIRNIGFSAHTTIAAIAAMNEYKFDTVMFPINFVEHFAFGFGQAVLELAHNQGVSVIAIKPTSAGAWPEDVSRKDRNWWYRIIDDEPNLGRALRFSLSQKNVVSAIPASFLNHFDSVITSPRIDEPIIRSEMEELHAFARTSNSHFLKEQKRGLMGSLHRLSRWDSRMG